MNLSPNIARGIGWLIIALATVVPILMGVFLHRTSGIVFGSAVGVSAVILLISRSGPDLDTSSGQPRAVFRFPSLAPGLVIIGMWAVAIILMVVLPSGH